MKAIFTQKRLPEAWRSVPLGSVVDFIGGSQPPKETFRTEPYEGGVRLVQIRDFRTDKFPTYIPQSLARRHFEESDVMIGRYGPPVFQILRGLSGSYNVALMKAAPKPDLTKDYLFHLLQEPGLHQHVVANSERTAGQSGVNLTLLEAIEIPLPPLAEQRRIAEVLDRAEALRAKRRAALAELDSLTQSLFLDLFGDPASLSLQHPVSPLESILYRPLQNGAYYPKEAYSEDGVEMVHMSDAFYEVVPRGGLKRVICPQSDVEKYSLTEADILIARRSLTLEGAAKPCLIPPSSEALIFESSFIRVTPDPAKVSALYLYHYLGNERVKQKCVQPFITQSTISGINQSNLERVPVVVPPIALQQEFARRVGAVEKLKQAQRAALAEQDALFATLQHRAFRGEL